MPLPDRYAILDPSAHTDADRAAILALLPAGESLERVLEFRDVLWPGCVLVDLLDWAIILGEGRRYVG